MVRIAGATSSAKKKTIHAPKVLNEPTHYAKPASFSRGISVDLGSHAILFISGTASINKDGRSIHPGGFLAQAKRTFKNLTALLKSEGATWHDVIRTTCYLKDMRNYDVFNEFRNKFYKDHSLTIFPASTCIGANLCRPDLLVEVELIAILKVKKNGRKP